MHPQSETDTVQCVVWTWTRLQSHAGLPVLYSRALPVAWNPQFPLTDDACVFQQLKKLGISTLGDLYLQGSFNEMAAICETRPCTPLVVFLYY